MIEQDAIYSNEGIIYIVRSNAPEAVPIEEILPKLFNIKPPRYQGFFFSTDDHSIGGFPSEVEEPAPAWTSGWTDFSHISISLDLTDEEEDDDDDGHPIGGLSSDDDPMVSPEFLAEVEPLDPGASASDYAIQQLRAEARRLYDISIEELESLPPVVVAFPSRDQLPPESEPFVPHGEDALRATSHPDYSAVWVTRDESDHLHIDRAPLHTAFDARFVMEADPDHVTLVYHDESETTAPLQEIHLHARNGTAKYAVEQYDPLRCIYLCKRIALLGDISGDPA